MWEAVKAKQEAQQEEKLFTNAEKEKRLTQSPRGSENHQVSMQLHHFTPL